MPLQPAHCVTIAIIIISYNHIYVSHTKTTESTPTEHIFLIFFSFLIELFYGFDLPSNSMSHESPNNTTNNNINKSVTMFSLIHTQLFVFEFVV